MIGADVMSNMTSPQYTPHRLLNYACQELGVETYFALAKRIDVDSATISRISTRKHMVSRAVIIALLDAIPQLTIAKLRELAGMPRE